MEFCLILKELRSSKKMSQKDLADVLGITYQAVSFYENNKRQPSFETLTKIADYFDVSTDYLLGETNIKKPITFNEKVFSDALRKIRNNSIQKIKEDSFEKIDDNNLQDIKIMSLSLSAEPIVELICKKWDIENEFYIPNDIIEITVQILEKALDIYFMNNKKTL